MTSRAFGKVVLACVSLTCEGAKSYDTAPRVITEEGEEIPTEKLATEKPSEMWELSNYGNGKAFEECRNQSPYVYHLAGFLCGRRYLAAKKAYEGVTQFDFFTPPEKLLKNPSQKAASKNAWQFFSVPISALAQLSHTPIFAIDEDKDENNIWRVSPEDDKKFLDNLLIATSEEDIKFSATAYYKKAVESYNNENDMRNAGNIKMRNLQDNVKKCIQYDIEKCTGRQLIVWLSKFLYKWQEQIREEEADYSPGLLIPSFRNFRYPPGLMAVQEPGLMNPTAASSSHEATGRSYIDQMQAWNMNDPTAASSQDPIFPEKPTGRSFDQIQAWMNGDNYKSERSRRVQARNEQKETRLSKLTENEKHLLNLNHSAAPWYQSHLARAMAEEYPDHAHPWQCMFSGVVPPHCMFPYEINGAEHFQNGGSQSVENGFQSGESSTTIGYADNTVRSSTGFLSRDFLDPKYVELPNY